MRKFSTVIVSNRLPVSVSKQNGELSYSQSDGGLATAVSSLDVEDKIWIGWPGIAADELTDDDKREITTELQSRGCYPVFLTASDIELFYEGYANDTLWPLCHYFQSHMVTRDDYWKAYRSVNRAYRDATKKLADDTARVWVHDYQLMLLPRLLREALPDTLIGYFHHIPFPSFEVFRLLPERKEILQGLLGADLVGFHVYDYARHFLSSCLRLLGISNEYGALHVDDRLVRVDAFPISIDYDKFSSLAASESSQEAYRSLLETYDGQKLIFSVDRLDYSKGIIERLEGFQRFLEDNPAYLGNVVLNMVVSPSRTGVEAYQQLQTQIEQTVSRINGEFGTHEWMPIYYQFQTLPLEEIIPLYMAADTMLVTPRRDGMNLVAKEFIAAKGDIPGTLILSEMTGAVDELPESLVVNPNDTLAIARAIKASFTMSKKEQRERLAAMQKRIREYPVTAWGADFLSALDRVHSEQSDAAVPSLRGDKVDQVVDRAVAASSRLLMLDYDGTIQTFKSSPAPSAAAPSKKLHDIIARLSADEKTTLCIVSGRPKAALESWFGDTSAVLVAEHGAWMRCGGEWVKRAEDFEDARERILPVLEDYASRTPGARIEQKDFASVWHYRNVAIDLALARAYNLRHELRLAIGDAPVSVHQGHSIIEVKPASVHKGVAAQSIFDESTADFVLVAGDDYTDEDMFAAAPKGATTIKVGLGETAAGYRISSVAALIRLLEKL